MPPSWTLRYSLGFFRASLGCLEVISSSLGALSGSFELSRSFLGSLGVFLEVSVRALLELSRTLLALSSWGALGALSGLSVGVPQVD